MLVRVDGAFISRLTLGERLAVMQKLGREMTTTPVNLSVEDALMSPGLRWVNDVSGG